LFSRVFISFSFSREKLAKLPRTIHLRMGGFRPSRAVDSQIPL